MDSALVGSWPSSGAGKNAPLAGQSCFVDKQIHHTAMGAIIASLRDIVIAVDCRGFLEPFSTNPW